MSKHETPRGATTYTVRMVRFGHGGLTEWKTFTNEGALARARRCFDRAVADPRTQEAELTRDGRSADDPEYLEHARRSQPDGEAVKGPLAHPRPPDRRREPGRPRGK